MDYLHPPVPTILIYPSPPPRLPLFRVDPWRTEWGVVVFQRRCAGQPAFIRMNQRGDKISPVTKQGYEIRVLIEFSSPGRGCGALNIIEFDRLMKRAPVLVLPLSTGPGEKLSTSTICIRTHADVGHACRPNLTARKSFFFKAHSNACCDYV